MAEDQPPQTRAVLHSGPDGSPRTTLRPSRDVLIVLLFVATLIGLCLMLYLFRTVWGEGLSAGSL